MLLSPPPSPASNEAMPPVARSWNGLRRMPYATRTRSAEASKSQQQQAVPWVPTPARFCGLMGCSVVRADPFAAWRRAWHVIDRGHRAGRGHGARPARRATGGAGSSRAATAARGGGGEPAHDAPRKEDAKVALDPARILNRTPKLRRGRPRVGPGSPGIANPSLVGGEGDLLVQGRPRALPGAMLGSTNDSWRDRGWFRDRLARGNAVDRPVVPQLLIGDRALSAARPATRRAPRGDPADQLDDGAGLAIAALQNQHREAQPGAVAPLGSLVTRCLSLSVVYKDDATSSRTNYISHVKALGGSRLFRTASGSISLFRAERKTARNDFFATCANKDYRGSSLPARCVSIEVVPAPGSCRRQPPCRMSHLGTGCAGPLGR